MSHLTDVLHDIAKGTGLTYLHDKIDHIHDEVPVDETATADTQDDGKDA